MEKVMLETLVNAVMGTNGKVYLTEEGIQKLTNMFADHGRSLYANKNTSIPIKIVENVG